MNMIWLVIFIVSACFLAGVMVKRKLSIRWIGYALLNAALAALALFILNSIDMLHSLHLPINMVTIAVIGGLGLPGLLLLIALKSVLFQ